MNFGLPWTSKGKKGPELSAPNRNADSGSIHDQPDMRLHLERLSRITAGKIAAPGVAAHSIARDQPLPDGGSNPHAHLNQRLAEFAAEGRAATSEVAHQAGEGTLNRNPPSHNLSVLEDRLRKITVQMESLQPCPVKDAMPALMQELRDMNRSLAEAVPRQAIEAIEAEVRGLAERLDQSRQSGVDASALTNLEHGLAEIRDALQSLKPAESLVVLQTAVQGLARKIDGIVASQQDPVMLQQLESVITGLRGIVAHVASDDTLTRLTEEVRGIAVKLERTAGPVPTPDSLANLERQIGAIAEAVDESNAKGCQLPAKFETNFRELADKVERLQLSRGDTIAFGQLEERITKLVEKLDASGSRFNQLEAIERGLADVLVHLEEQRAHGGGALRAPVSDPAMESLKRDLNAVNGTLNRVVDRLASIETGTRAGNRLSCAAPDAADPDRSAAGPAADAAPADSPSTLPDATAVAEKVPILPATPAAVEASAGKPVPTPCEQFSAAQVQRPASPRERPPIDPNLPPDHPLEPGAAHARTARSPAERIAASEAALAAAKPPIIPDPGGKTNFIAAARHAARTASQLPQGDKNDKGAVGSTDTASSSMRQRLSDYGRSLLIGASVLVLAIGAVRMGITLIELIPAEAPVAQQTQAPAILPAPSSTAHVMPEPIVSESARPGEDELRNSNGQVGPINPPPERGSGNAPAATVPQGPPARHDETHVTGSIPPRTAVAAGPAAVPLSPSGSDGEDPAKPPSRLAAAAAAGDPAAAYELAVRYIEGRGVKRSYQDAVRWLTGASKQGVAPAQFRLGSFYEKGLGVRKDLNEARRLYAAAAAKGNAKAMHNLAVLHAEGFTGKPDYKLASQWFRKAADRGIADSQYNLGVLYARGVGVEQNLAESYKWFALAAQQGDKESARKRDEVAASLDSKSLVAARLAVKTWAIEPQPEEATTVKIPPGGWDQAAPAKRAPRIGAPLNIGPG